MTDKAVNKIEALEDTETSSFTANPFDEALGEPPADRDYFASLIDKVPASGEVANATDGQTIPTAAEIEAATTVNELQHPSPMDAAAPIPAVNTVQFDATAFQQLSNTEQREVLVHSLQSARRQAEIAHTKISTNTTSLKSNVVERLELRTQQTSAEAVSLFELLGKKPPAVAEAPEAISRVKMPLKKVFNYLIDAEVGFTSLAHDVEKVDSKSFSPAKVLAMQMKVVHITQELEFFTNVLNQSLSSIKQLMSVQI